MSTEPDQLKGGQVGRATNGLLDASIILVFMLLPVLAAVTHDILDNTLHILCGSVYSQGYAIGSWCSKRL